MKPSSYLTLKTGKALAAFTGFVSMFNWMEKFLYYIRSKSGTITISDPDNNEKYSLDIKGYNAASTDTVPTKTSNGLEWKKPELSDPVEPDDLTITDQDRSDGKLSITGGYDAGPSKVPIMGSGGALTWDYPMYVNSNRAASLTLKAGSDSSLVFTPTLSGSTLELAIDVYYK